MIAIRGSGFGDGATVTFDGVAATDVVVIDQTEITCTPPAHADGLVAVVVTNLDGTTGELDDVFCYTTLSATPDDGPIAGGTTVTLTISDGGAGVAWFPADHLYVVYINNRLRALGTHLDDPDLIFNPAAEGTLPYTVLSDNELQIDATGEEPCGPTDVVVFDMTLYAAGEPNVVFYLPLGYTYLLDAPTITDMTPASGPARGGTHVTITGSFSCTTCEGGGRVRATIDGVPLTSVICTPTTLTGITGVHDAGGPFQLIVTGPDGQNAALDNAFTWVAAPIVGNIDPNHGPTEGGTAVTIQGSFFEDGATVMLAGTITDPNDPPENPPFYAVADCTDVVFIDGSTLTAVTSACPAGIVDVIVTNPDGQRGTLERGYAYEGWWISLDDFPIWTYDDVPPPGIRGRRWRRETLLVPGPDGWWVSTAAFGGAITVVVDSRPKNPRMWSQIAAFATGSAAMLGGSPGIAAVFHNRLIYAASDYTVGSTAPPLRIYDGSFDRELCRLPPTSSNTPPIAVLSMLVANGTVYVSTLDSGSSSSDWVGRVFSLDLNTATLTPVGAAFPAGHLPYALAWHNGLLWCGTHRQATSVAGKLFSIRPDLADAAWAEETALSVPAGHSVAALYSWKGKLYAGLTAPAATFATIYARGEDSTWTVVDTGSGGTATANNGYLAFTACTDVIGEALYASYWNADTPAIALVRKTTDGTTWTTDYTGAAGTLRPYIVLTVDGGELFVVGGGAHLTAAILRRTNDGSWQDLTNELPDDDKTALPAVAVLVL